MRILQIHNYYAIRGGECGVVDAEKQLLESHGHDVSQFTRSSRALSDARLFDKVYDYASISHNARVERHLTHLLNKEKPDVAHVHNVFPLLSPAVYATLKKYNIPIIQTVHNFRFICPNGTFFTRGKICERCQKDGFSQAVKYRCVRNSLITSVKYASAISRMWREGVLTKTIDKFIVLNKFSMEKLARAGIPRHKVEICGNFAANIDYRLQDKEDYIVYLGRLSPEKGIRTIIAAARMLHEGCIRIAGTGPLKDEVRRAASELGNLEFVGYVDGQQKEDLIRKARAMIVPSEWYENFPISVVESMSMGTPVIASNIGGLPEMIEHGRTGLLFEPGDAARLVAHIESLRTDTRLATDMSHAALTQARKQFNREKHVVELEKIYQGAIAESTAGSQGARV